MLDTPGFNESRSNPHLRTMFRERLQHANAVLAVLDYTQLRSEAEDELITELREIAHHAQGRMFALVNKFDREDANSDNAEATVHYVSHKLLNGVVSAARIFPVSAQLAYLAQRARASMASNEADDVLGWKEGREPDWRDDFGKQAFGRRYGASMNDATKVRDGIEQLWDASRFVAPMQDIIHFSQIGAVRFALESSLDQLQALVQWLDDTD